MSIDFSPDAEVDVETAVDELVDRYGPSLAVAFRTRLQRTLTRVATMPLVYSLVDPPLPNHPGLRVVPIARFESRLIFYTPTATGILAVRVLLAASDWQATLGD
jgi:plasmid stabilization system protein ParE